VDDNVVGNAIGEIAKGFLPAHWQFLVVPAVTILGFAFKYWMEARAAKRKERDSELNRLASENTSQREQNAKLQETLIRQADQLIQLVDSTKEASVAHTDAAKATQTLLVGITDVVVNLKRAIDEKPARLGIS
jgi:Flp pilus assembly protein TadB